MKIMKKLILILSCISFSFIGNTQTKQNPEVPSPIIFIYDASGSMWGQLQGKTKMEIAASVLTSSIKELPENQNIGLVAYGHRKKGDCLDVETLVAMDNSSKSKISTAIDNIKPLGKTPLALSAKKVIDQLRSSKEKATIILITDGIESCDGNICDVVAAAKKEGIDFKLHIVGFGLKSQETKQLKCAAKAGEGNYYDAADASGLSIAMSEVVTETIDKPKGNHGVYASKNGEAIDALVIAYKSGTKNEAGGTRTYGDTSYVFLPRGLYDIEVRPLENTKISPITITNVQTYNDKVTHQMVRFDGAKIKLVTTNNDQNWDCVVDIINEEGKRVAGHRTYNKVNTFDIDPGTYTIKTRPLKLIGLETEMITENIVIEAGETESVVHNLKTGTAKLGVQTNGTLVDVVLNIYASDKKTHIGGARTYTSASGNPRAFQITPGQYTVQLRGRKGGKDTIKWSEFIVKEGETITKMFEW